MKTPIFDFVKAYAESDVSRLHMPGHKGKSFLGCEPLDITEIDGADVLYSADGIIAESEGNATRLFGSVHTFYSVEGSSLCIKAMLAIATQGAERPVILAARNVHKAFVHACALLDCRVRWLYGEENGHLCSCKVTAEQVEKELDGSVAAVYLTSPDYLGNIADIEGIARVCHAHGVPLLVDNAHGAYLKFLKPSRHPLELGADMCCDSAHKTLPVLTGGAYLHVARQEYALSARNALSVFASTSPSYLLLQSLDLCNKYLSDGYAERLDVCIAKLKKIKKSLLDKGFCVESTEPLKLVINANKAGYTGNELAELLRERKIEIEFSDAEYVVMMITPETRDIDLERLINALDSIPRRAPIATEQCNTIAAPESVMSIRRAVFSRRTTVPTASAVGRVCAAPTVSCPPAVPIVISGERITKQHVALLWRYGIETVEVVEI